MIETKFHYELRYCIKQFEEKTIIFKYDMIGSLESKFSYLLVRSCNM